MRRGRGSWGACCTTYEGTPKPQRHLISHIFTFGVVNFVTRHLLSPSRVAETHAPRHSRKLVCSVCLCGIRCYSPILCCQKYCKCRASREQLQQELWPNCAVFVGTRALTSLRKNSIAAIVVVEFFFQQLSRTAPLQKAFAALLYDGPHSAPAGALRGLSRANQDGMDSTGMMSCLLGPVRPSSY